ncbi:hypothetical protein [Labilibaculum antarcticum]|uniref:Uncharacterized protein n=1 Tax=Labilibaculum antarcticum TaxID=1717717 RepID=A0A1Y1CRH0_9BACT|nr:hypothetical protein [Labilibaculum antarcticum]BAX82522.1 hypothetical protein ALGA_4231 [Labilibaculum antarcticum]
MEKSIETIWKEGFLESDALVVPKLNDLYNQKSKHIIDKFKRMFRINLNALFIGSFVILIASAIVGIPIMGIGYFFILNAIVLVNRRLMKGLIKIDKNVSSYQYLKSFNNWMKEQLAVNRKLARYYYPLIFLFMVLGFWFSQDIQETFKGILERPNQIYLVNNIPVLWTIPIAIITGLLAYFGDRIYNFDVSLIYGQVFRKLDELIADIEELRA